jgi:UDP-glucose 4-epimerase
VIYGDGRQTRCFAHVKDVVTAMVKLMEEPKAVGDVFNIGSEHEISINDLAKKVKKMTNSSSGIEHISYDEAYGTGFEDMSRRTPNLLKIKKLVGYGPTFTLDEIIMDIIEHFKK